MRIRLLTVVCGLAVAGQCFGLELIHLKNGFTLEADSHQADGDMLVLQVGSGSLTVAQAEISSVELVSGPVSPLPEKSKAGDLSPEKLLADAAQAYGIDPAFVQSVARIESGLRQDAVSVKGALGLMQLMPGTAADLQVNPNEAASNASGGARYLRELLLRYKGDSVLALAAYNAGPGAVQKYRGAPPYEETRKYIVKVLEQYRKQLKGRAAASAPSAQKASSTTSKPSATD